MSFNRILSDPVNFAADELLEVLIDEYKTHMIKMTNPIMLCVSKDLALLLSSFPESVFVLLFPEKSGLHI